ncbi:MAG TPA: hypothetical protein ENI07_01310 [Desulfobacterales bacterium]|nr:hypothetical protein [Desulfobacterales bacterium]
MNKVSIILPTIRRIKAERCIEAALKYKGSVDVEIVQGFDTNRIGAPKMIKRLVDKSSHDLVMFLGDDTIPREGYMDGALKAMATLPDGWGLVGLNDQLNDGELLATHWLADKRLLPLLDGEFFHTGYWHCFCDRELTIRCKELSRYVYAPNAIINHDHPMKTGHPLTGDYGRVYSKKWFDHDSNLLADRSRNEWA